MADKAFKSARIFVLGKDMDKHSSLYDKTFFCVTYKETK
jgi:hypothetical protein